MVKLKKEELRPNIEISPLAEENRTEQNRTYYYMIKGRPKYCVHIS